MKTFIITSFSILFITTQCLGQPLEMRDTTYVSSENISSPCSKECCSVPENEATPRISSDSISFIRLKSLSDTSQTPLIYLEGGGSPCTWQAEEPDMLSEWLPYLKVSDVILVDQRGTADENLLYISELEYPVILWSAKMLREPTGGKWQRKHCRSFSRRKLM